MNMWCVMIRGYQYSLSPFLQFLGAQCRSTPSCSQYAYRMFAQYPVWTALRLSARRLWRCQPRYASQEPVHEI